MKRLDNENNDPSLASVAVRAVETGMKMGEMMLASNYVLNARMTMLGDAMRNPLDADFREFERFVPEKVAALSRSGAAWFHGACQLQRDLGDQFVDWGMVMLGGLPTPARLARLADASTRRGTRALMFPVVTGDAAIEPVHHTVTANARRLRDVAAVPGAA